MDGHAILYDSLARKSDSFYPHTDAITGMFTYFDYLISASEDGSIVYTNKNTMKELLRSYRFQDGTVLNITPEGYFSGNGAKHLSILTGPDTVSSIDQFYETFYRPDMVKNALEIFYDPGTGPKLADVKPAPDVAFYNTPDFTDKQSAEITVKITPKGGGIGEIRLYVDGTIIKTDAGRSLKVIKDNSVYKTFNIRLSEGAHSIQVTAFNEQNTMQSVAAVKNIISTYKTAKKPDVYAVIIGINEYEVQSSNLRYAVADAQLFADTLKKTAAGLFNKVNITLLTTKEETTKDNIIKVMQSYQNLPTEDMFVFYDASHGIILNSRYLMITSNVMIASNKMIEDNSINQDTLKNLISNIPTSKKLIVFDTCRSGGVAMAIQSTMMTRGLSEVGAFDVLSRAVGSTILSSASSSQDAMEGYNGHGLFTYILTEGMNGKADADKDGYVKTLEIANYVEDAVPEAAKRIFNREQYPYVAPMGSGFPIGKVR